MSAASPGWKMYASMLIDGVGRQNSVAHRGIELPAVGEDLDTIVAVNRRLTRRLQDVNEFVAIGAERSR
jgi:hypothetical protein